MNLNIILSLFTTTNFPGSLKLRRPAQHRSSRNVQKKQNRVPNQGTGIHCQRGLQGQEMKIVITLSHFT